MKVKITARERALKIAKQLLKQAVRVMHGAGFSWKKIEVELKLRRCRGMTSWRAAGNKHPMTKRVVGRKPGVTVGRAFRRSARVGG